MPLNLPSGNMYPWAYTWNPIGGKCLHECSYCYVPRLGKRGLKKYLKAPYLDEKELKTKLSIPNNFMLFVCSCYDLFGDWVPEDWIIRILNHCSEYNGMFLFQSKNPRRMLEFKEYMPKYYVLGTTIETNRDYGLSKAPSPYERYKTVMDNKNSVFWMISNEPILDFDLPVMVEWTKNVKPTFISVGADSGKNGLAEPSKQNLMEYINNCRMFTQVKIKKNLDRLII